MAQRLAGIHEGSGGGSSYRIAELTSNVVRPRKGNLPEAASYSTTPSPQMSPRASASWPRKTSGGM